MKLDHFYAWKTCQDSAASRDAVKECCRVADWWLKNWYVHSGGNSDDEDIDSVSESSFTEEMKDDLCRLPKEDQQAALKFLQKDIAESRVSVKHVRFVDYTGDNLRRLERQKYLCGFLSNRWGTRGQFLNKGLVVKGDAFGCVIKGCRKNVNPSPHDYFDFVVFNEDDTERK